MNEVFQAIAIISMGIVGTAVVFARDPVRQALVLGIYGMTMIVTFVALQAPDVSLSAIVITTVALPPMVLLALRKLREYRQESGE
ncbi:MAG: energy-converting hydrogenase subunit [Thermoleophilaceae bacterium]|nr:energy-converting hydrogenase subunit [Thermoleophilaceae bacterium]